MKNDGFRRSLPLLGFTAMVLGGSFIAMNSEPVLQNTQAKKEVIEKSVSETEASNPNMENFFTEKLHKNFPGINVVKAIHDELTDLYLIKTLDGSSFYTNDRGEFAIMSTGKPTPEIFLLTGDKPLNLTSKISRPFNLEVSNAYGEYLTYKAENEIAKVKVFVDPACGYCQLLHNEIESYQKAGITIEYAPLPIFGDIPFDGLARIWSLPADQRPAAFTKVKKHFAENRGQKPDYEKMGLPEATQAGIDAVSKGKIIGKSLGFTGTPGLVLPNGDALGGYLPAEKLRDHILKNK